MSQSITLSVYLSVCLRLFLSGVSLSAPLARLAFPSPCFVSLSLVCLAPFSLSSALRYICGQCRDFIFFGYQWRVRPSVCLSDFLPICECPTPHPSRGFILSFGCFRPFNFKFFFQLLIFLVQHDADRYSCWMKKVRMLRVRDTVCTTEWSEWIKHEVPRNCSFTGLRVSEKYLHLYLGWKVYYLRGVLPSFIFWMNLSSAGIVWNVGIVKIFQQKVSDGSVRSPYISYHYHFQGKQESTPKVWMASGQICENIPQWYCKICLKPFSFFWVEKCFVVTISQEVWSASYGDKKSRHVSCGCLPVTSLSRQWFRAW